MENIKEMVEKFKVVVYKRRSNMALPSDKVGTATVVGAYSRTYWHPYVYSAYHVIFDDGRKDTVYADHCKAVSK